MLLNHQVSVISLASLMAKIKIGTTTPIAAAVNTNRLTTDSP